MYIRMCGLRERSNVTPRMGLFRKMKKKKDWEISDRDFNDCNKTLAKIKEGWDKTK